VHTTQYKYVSGLGATPVRWLGVCVKKNI